MRKEIFEGYRTIIFFVMATAFFMLHIFYGRGLNSEMWLVASSLFLGKNGFESIIKYKSTIKLEKKNDNNIE